MRPSFIRRAAPTLKLEYGASAFSRAAVAFVMRSVLALRFMRLEEPLEQHSNIGIHLRGCLENLGMIDGFAGYSSGNICQHRQSGYLHPHVFCDDCFRNGGHPGGIRSDLAEVTDLRWSFIRRTGHCRVNTFANLNIAEFSRRLQFEPQVRIVDMSLVEESRPPSVFVRAAERICAHQIDVICDKHQVAARKVRIDSPGSVRQDQALRAQPPDNTCAECDFRHGVPFVVMDPAFENHNAKLAGLTEYDLPAMAGDFRNRKMRYGRVVNTLRSGQNLIDRGQAAAHHDCYFRNLPHLIQ